MYITNGWDGSVLVRAFTKRPDPVWLRKQKGSEKKSNTGLTRKHLPDSDIRNALLALLRAQPGRARTHYVQLPPSEGGCSGSQGRKAQLLDTLITEGTVQERKLEKPQGRKTHGLYLAN